MNTLMYEHPLTSEHIQIIRNVVRYNVVGPIGKALACGDVGAYQVSCRLLLFIFQNNPFVVINGR